MTTLGSLDLPVSKPASIISAKPPLSYKGRVTGSKDEDINVFVGPLFSLPHSARSQLNQGKNSDSLTDCGLEKGLKNGHYQDPLLILLDCFFIAQYEKVFFFFFFPL